MSEDYAFVPYAPEYKEDVLLLASHVWSAEPAINAAYFKWKYEHNPYMAAPAFYLALYEGRAVAMRGLVNSRWESGGEFFSVPCFGDSAAVPEHRGRGLMRSITRAALNDVGSNRPSYVFSLSAGAFTRRAFVENGAITITLPATYTRAAEDVDARPSCRLESIVTRPHNEPIQLDSDIWLESRPRVEAMANLVERLPRDGRIRHVRDGAYLSWRFDNPLSRYWFLFHATGDELDAYLVLQMSRKKEGVFNIVDCEALNSRDVPALLRAALTFCGAFPVNVWPDTLTGSQLETVNHLGFFEWRDNRSPRILVGSASRAPLRAEWELGSQRLREPANWDMRMIYSDNY